MFNLTEKYVKIYKNSPKNTNTIIRKNTKKTISNIFPCLYIVIVKSDLNCPFFVQQ